MTPEERARAVVAAWYRGPYNIHSFDPNDEERRIEIATIAAAIRAAVAAEREACAELCDAQLRRQARAV